MTYRRLNIDWTRKRELHEDYCETLKCLAYDKKTLGMNLIALFRKRKNAKLEYKEKYKTAKNYIEKIKKMASDLEKYTEDWIKDGNTEDNLFLFVDAYNLLLEYGKLREKKVEVFKAPKIAKQVYQQYESTVKNTEALIKKAKGKYRNVQRQIDENATHHQVLDCTETPSEEIQINVGVQRYQLSIKKESYYPTCKLRYHKTANGWFPYTKDTYGPKLNTVQATMLEKEVNKFIK